MCAALARLPLAEMLEAPTSARPVLTTNEPANDTTKVSYKRLNRSFGFLPRIESLPLFHAWRP